MVLPRASMRWTGRLASSSTARARTSIRNPRIWQPKSCRGYASEGSGHGSKKSSGDLPWAITSAGISIPAAVYLMQSGPDTGHGHEHGEAEHGEEDDEAHGEEEEGSGEVIEPVPNLHKGSSDEGGEEQDQDNAEEGEEGGEEKSGEKTGDSSSEGEDQQDTPDTSDDEQSENVAHEIDSGENVEGVQFKGATSGGEQGDTRKHIPDPKGGNKKRIESEYGNRQGIASEEDQEKDENGRTIDKPAASKTPGGPGTQSGKQEGLSNTDTKHSTNIENDPDKSKKGEGTPETAKSKGTVDPQRPQA